MEWGMGIALLPRMLWSLVGPIADFSFVSSGKWPTREMIPMSPTDYKRREKMIMLRKLGNYLRVKVKYVFSSYMCLPVF